MVPAPSRRRSIIFSRASLSGRRVRVHVGSDCRKHRIIGRSTAQNQCNVPGGRHTYPVKMISFRIHPASAAGESAWSGISLVGRCARSRKKLRHARARARTGASLRAPLSKSAGIRSPSSPGMCPVYTSTRTPIRAEGNYSATVPAARSHRIRTSHDFPREASRWQFCRNVSKEIRAQFGYALQWARTPGIPPIGGT